MTAGVHRCLCTNTKPYSRSLHAHTPMSQSRVPYVYSASHLHQLRRVCVQQRGGTVAGREKPKLRLDERRAAAKRWVVVEHSPRTHRVQGSPARCWVSPACVHMSPIAGSWACLRTVSWQTACASACIHLQHSRLAPRGQSPPKGLHGAWINQRAELRGTGAGGSLQASATQLVAPLDPL